MTPNNGTKWALALTGILTALLAAGCKTAPTSTICQSFDSPYPQNQLVAVPVFLNQSGSADVDMMAVTDAFCAELQAIEGIEVTTVNVTQATLREMGLRSVSSVAEALALADKLEVDMVIVGAVTSYQPYFPPELALAVELYRRADWSPAEQAETLESRKLAQAAKEFHLTPLDPMRPASRVVRIVNADEKPVVDRLKRYAGSRTGQDRPYGWKQYTTRKEFPRFVSHEVIGELLAHERKRLLAEHSIQPDGDDK